MPKLRTASIMSRAKSRQVPAPRASVSAGACSPSERVWYSKPALTALVIATSSAPVSVGPFSAKNRRAQSSTLWSGSG